MANEITMTVRVQASKGGTSVVNGTTAFTEDMGGNQMYHANPEISTTAAALTVGPVNQSNRYWLLVRNNDATNEVWLSLNNGSTYPIIVPPGMVAGPILIAAGQTLFADAQVATCECEVVAIEV